MGVTSENIAEKWCVYFNSRMSNSTDAVFCSQVNHPRATGHARGEVARARRRRAEKRPVRLADRPGPHAVARSQDERGDTHPRREGRRHSRGHHPGELILFLFILLFSHFNFFFPFLYCDVLHILGTSYRDRGFVFLFFLFFKPFFLAFPLFRLGPFLFLGLYLSPSFFLGGFTRFRYILKG